MPYVMVPVPEEHEKEFQSELLQLTLRASINAWDAAMVQGLLDELDEPALALVRVLVDAASANRRLTRQQVAELLQSDVATVSSLAERINHRSAGKGRPYLILVAPGEDPKAGEAAEVLLITQVAVRLLQTLLGGDAGPS